MSMAWISGHAAESEAALDNALQCLGADWYQSPLRPRVDTGICFSWNRLIEDWIASDLPLPVRKSAMARGGCVIHQSGRRLTGADNTIANWVMDCAIRQKTPDLDEVGRMFAEAEMPLAMVLKTAERSLALYTRRGLRRALGPNAYGWKVCHLDRVGLGFSFDPVSASLESIAAHVRKLLSPDNMMLLPLKLGGMGEVPAFLKGFCVERDKQGEGS